MSEALPLRKRADQLKSSVLKALKASSQPSAGFQVAWPESLLHEQQQVQAQLPVLHRHGQLCQKALFYFGREHQFTAC